MTGRIIAALIFGLVGTAILVGLGTWQVQRLAWKQGILAEIDATILGTPGAIPARPDPETHAYLPVTATGQLTGEELQVLASVKRRGPGFRVISVLETEGRRVLVDRGFVAPEQKEAPRPPAEVTITGNLHWPDEVDGWTPEPDTKAQIWFARDLPAMATALNTEPVLIVARDTTATTPPVTPLPIDSAAIPNDHLQYAITWFSLAAIWLGMTAYLIWRIRRQTA